MTNQEISQATTNSDQSIEKKVELQTEEPILLSIIVNYKDTSMTLKAAKTTCIADLYPYAVDYFRRLTNFDIYENDNVLALDMPIENLSGNTLEIRNKVYDGLQVKIHVLKTKEWFGLETQPSIYLKGDAMYQPQLEKVLQSLELVKPFSTFDQMHGKLAEIRATINGKEYCLSAQTDGFVVDNVCYESLSDFVVAMEPSAAEYLSTANPYYSISASTFCNRFPVFVSVPKTVSAVPPSAFIDWNEEMVTQKEGLLQLDDISLRIHQERAIARLYRDFLDSCLRSVIDIVHGNIQALNPTDPFQTQMFVHNNIFFSIANDTECSQEECRVRFKKDVEAIKRFDRVGGISTIATCIVDYKGWRMACQTIIPGIFRLPENEKFIHGTNEKKQRLVSEQVQEICVKTIDSLGLKSSALVLEDGEKVELKVSCDLKGVKGADARMYAIDLYTTYPIDIMWVEENTQYGHSLCMLRPELVEIYVSRNKDARLNPNAFRCKLEDGAADEQEVRNASEFLREVLIGSLLKDLESNVPFDGITLSESFHRLGVNMRYLGLVATQLAESKVRSHSFTYELAVHEMISRAAKRVLRERMMPATLQQVPIVIAEFFNALASIQDDLMNELSNELVEIIQRRFNFEWIKESFHWRVLLRRICAMVGIQLLDRDYESSIIPSDVLNLAPVVAHSEPRSLLTVKTFEAARLTFRMGEKINEARDLFHETVLLHEQIHGPIHPETALCYYEYAWVYQALKDVQSAADYMSKAALISERLLGPDDADTLHSSLQMAIFEFNRNNHQKSLQVMRLVEKYWRAYILPHHPVFSKLLMNLAIMEQTIKNYDRSVALLEECNQLYVRYYGENDDSIAQCFNILTGVYLESGNAKEALNVEKKSYNILAEKYGKKDKRVKLCSARLLAITKEAVEQAKKQKA